MNTPVFINYGTAVITLVFGILIVSGFYLKGSGPEIKMFGIILIAYSIYRFISTYNKVRQRKLREKIEKLKSETDKLIHKK